MPAPGEAASQGPPEEEAEAAAAPEVEAAAAGAASESADAAGPRGGEEKKKRKKKKRKAAANAGGGTLSRQTQRVSLGRVGVGEPAKRPLSFSALSGGFVGWTGRSTVCWSGVPSKAREAFRITCFLVPAATVEP